MRLLKASIVCLVLGLASAADAETCTSSGSGRWTAVGTGPWTGCTASNDDTFTVASGHVVYVDGTVTVTTGNVIVQSGGTLHVTAGSILNQGASLHVQDGSTLIATGDVRNKCRIASEPAWGADDTPDVVLDCGAAASAGTSDYIVFLEDDPVDGFFNRKTVHAGPGFSPGAYQQALNRWAWYDITAVSGSTVTYDLDSGTYAAGGDAPYQGTRGLPTVADITTMTFTALEGGLYTRVVLDAGGPQPVAMAGDLGSMYLYFEESAANAADPAYCSGLAAKILHTENDAVGGDQLYVLGDVTRCTSATARVIPGARRGDEVALVTPATIDGIVGAAHTGYILIDTGATVQIRWARLTRLGVLTRTVPDPDIQRHCNVCLIQSATNPSGTISGWIADSEISFPEAHATQDTGVLYASAATSANDLRYPNVGPIDLRGMRFERLHIHDSRNAITGGGGGGHGFYMEAVMRLDADGLRVERISDDGMGGQVISNQTGTSEAANSLTIKRALVYENIAEDDNSQEGVEFSITASVNQATTGEDNFIFNRGALDLQDIVAVGSYRGTIIYNGLGHVSNRTVNGGQFGSSIPFSVICSASGATVNGTYGTYSNRFSNSLITSFQASGTANSAYPSLCGELKDSVAFGNEQSTDTATDTGSTDAYNYIISCSGSFLFHKSGGTTPMNGLSSVAAVGGAIPRPFKDCALMSELGQTFGAQWSAAGSTNTLERTRAMFISGAVTFAAGGPDDFATGTITPRIDGFWATNAGPDADSWSIDSGGTVANACIRTTTVAGTAFGSYASSTTVSNPDLFPVFANLPKLGTLVQTPGFDDSPCETSKPRTLGLAEVGTAHVLMGDFFLMQLYPTYTSRKNLVRIVGQQSVNSTAPTGLPSW